MRIPLVNLRAQYDAVKPEVDAAIASVLTRSAYIGGTEVDDLQRWFASYCGVRHAVGVSSGTRALELVLRALHVGRGDEVVTSANTFIATAAAITAAGARPVLVDVDEATGNLDPDCVERAITTKTKAIVPVHLYGRPAAMDDVLDRWGRLDCVVNNAGVALARPITDTSLEEGRRLMAVNLDGVFLGTKHAVATMRTCGGGSIVNVSSASGLVGSAGASAYCASKGGVRLFTKAVALECARDGIRVNSVHPGGVRTPIWEKAEWWPGFVAQAGDGEHGKKSSLNPGRVGTGGPGYKFADEPVHGDYARGAVAMANAGPNTNGSQFFICQADLSGRLPKNYTIFGQVTKGMDVVDKIVNAPRDARDLPNDPVAMTKVTIHED